MDFAKKRTLRPCDNYLGAESEKSINWGGGGDPVVAGKRFVGESANSCTVQYIAEVFYYDHKIVAGGRTRAKGVPQLVEI